jgi:hypothetical protein
MTQLSNTFQFTAYMPSVYSCTVKMEVNSYTSGEQTKYKINYHYTVPEGEPSGQDNPAHPFYQKRVDDVSGVIVIQNAVTRPMVEYLMMSDSVLSHNTGTTTPMQYRKVLMNCLDSLWD